MWTNAIVELGGVVGGKTPGCDETECPWREWCYACETGDFTALDVPEQPDFEGSRRQFRGRGIRTFGNHDELILDDLGPAFASTIPWRERTRMASRTGF